VRFLGWRDDLETLYAAADVVLLTSDNEGTPVSLIEAAHAGRPVVATDVGSARHVVDDGHTGVLCPPDAMRLPAPCSTSSAIPALRRHGGRRAPERRRPVRPAAPGHRHRRASTSTCWPRPRCGGRGAGRRLDDGRRSGGSHGRTAATGREHEAGADEHQRGGHPEERPDLCTGRGMSPGAGAASAGPASAGPASAGPALAGSATVTTSDWTRSPQVAVTVN
jgi:hypothetical protein